MNGEKNIHLNTGWLAIIMRHFQRILSNRYRLLNRLENQSHFKHLITTTRPDSITGGIRDSFLHFFCWLRLNICSFKSRYQTANEAPDGSYTDCSSWVIKWYRQCGTKWFLIKRCWEHLRQVLKGNPKELEVSTLHQNYGNMVSSTYCRLRLEF